MKETELVTVLGVSDYTRTKELKLKIFRIIKGKKEKR